jgi:alkanesulfonate monooxygenase SsuD/methylene tetrahydromethanopterin reductase-like flavin-dependent oxidoreductase (luciferase family)
MTAAFTYPRIGVALDGAGWHPASWREPDARPHELFDANYWVELAQEAEWGLVDFISIEDSFAPIPVRRGAPDPRTDRVRGRLDAVLVAARVAPHTSSIGILPVATTTHTEPFHVSKAIATLDFVSEGRGGFQARISTSEAEAGLFGRRQGVAAGRADGSVPVDDLFDEAADFVNVVRRLWDSWEDGAEIRDAPTGRFIDRDKLHYIDFEGKWFSVKGPSITPRPPQGQPIVAVLAHVPPAFKLAARGADLVFVTPTSKDEAAALVEEVRTNEASVQRQGDPLEVFVDLVVFLDQESERAEDRKGRLDALLGRTYQSDAHVFTGTPSALVDLLLDWQTEGVAGFRLRPGSMPRDLEAITHEVIPTLQDRSAFPRHHGDATLRSRLGLQRPANRYAMT